MAEPWDEYAAASTGQPWDDFATPAAPPAAAPAPKPQKSSAVRRVLGDTAVDLGRGIVGAGEAVVGLADIPTMGYAGKGLEAAGYRPGAAKEIIGGFYSPERKAAQGEVEQAEGFVDTAGAMLRNPSTIAGTVVESVPSILGGGAIAQGLRAVRGLGAVARAGIGEGAVGAGMQAEGIRQETDDGLLTGRQVGAAVGTGVGTGLIGAAGGALARRLGVTDVDVAIAGGGTADAAQAAAGNPVRRALENTARGAVAEGVFEEMPQSMQEQAWQNVALDRPLGEGVPESAAMGLLAGMAMGGPVGALSGTRADATRLGPAPAPAPDPVAHEAELRARVDAAASPEARAAAQAELATYLERSGRLIAQEPVEVSPRGEARTAAQTRGLADQERALQRDFGLTPGVRGAQPGHPGFTRALPDGSPLPDPANGPMSRAAVMGVDNGAVDLAAAEQAAFAQAALEEQRASDRKKDVADAAGVTTQDRVAARVSAVRDEQAAEAAAAGEPAPQFTPEQIEAYLFEQASRGPLPKADVLARVYRMKPRDAYELRRRVIAETRRQALAQTAPEGTADDLPAQRPEAGRADSARALDAGGDRVAPAGVQGQPAGQPVPDAGGGTDAAAAAQPVAAAAPGEPDAGSLSDGDRPAASEAAPAPPPGGDVAVAEEVTAEEYAARRNRNRTTPVVKGDNWDTGAVLRGKAVGEIATIMGPRTPENPDGGMRWTKLQGERWTDGKSTLDTIGLARLFDQQDSSIDGTAARPPLELAAHEAATSAKNVLPAPTEAQKEAGNYKKGHARVAGLDVSIENPAGSRRRPEWPPLKDHYGYIRGSVGADKDHVDVFMTERAEDTSLPVFVVDQVDQNGRFDEHKVVMGAADEAEARQAYLRNYEKGWTGLGAITQMSQDEFKAWVKDPTKTKRPADSITAEREEYEARRSETAAAGATKAASTKRHRGERVAALGSGWKARSRQPGDGPVRHVYARTQGDRRATIGEGRFAEGKFEVHRAIKHTVRGWQPDSEGVKYFEDIDAAAAYANSLFAEAAAASGVPARETTQARRMVDTAPNGIKVGDRVVVAPRESGPQRESYEATVTAIEVNAAPVYKGTAFKVASDNATPDGRGTGWVGIHQITLAEPPSAGGGTSDAQADAPADAKIEDFGETLHGARKHLYAENYRDAMQAAEARDPSTSTMAQAWPAPDYAKLLEDGTDPWVVAFVRAARDEIPTKPTKAWKVKGWAAQVTALRKFSMDLIAGAIDAEGVKAKLLQPEFAALARHVGGRADLYQAVGHDLSLKGVSFAHHHYTLYRGQQNVSLWVVQKQQKATAFSNWPMELATGKTKDEAIDAFRKKAAELAAEQDVKDGKKPRRGTVRFNIYANRLTKDVFIGVQIGKGVVTVQGGFASSSAARAHLAEHADALEAKLAKMRQAPEIRRGNNSPRVGHDHRSGADVSPEQFGEAFGFRGVQFGNYVEGPRRQRDLNEAYDALMDLAGVLDIEPRALSLNGELGLAFGARGKGGKSAGAAHYEPDKVVINLTKGAGAGSLAHEWWHALDNYFASLRRGGNNYTYATDVATSRDAGDPMAMRAEMMAAYQRVMNAIKNTGLRERSLKLDEVRSKDYWSTGIEMSARSFESYVIAKLADQGAANDYLANVVSEQSFSGDNYPYPKAAELPVLRGAFDEFFAAIEQERTPDGNVRLYGRPNRSEAVALAELKSGRDDRGLAPERVREIAGAMTARWAGAPRIVVLEQDPGGEAQGAEGWYDAGRGEVVLVAPNIRGGYDPALKRRVTARERVQMVAVHEIVGHAGIEAITGPELWGELEQTIDRMRANGRHADLFASIDRRYRGANRSIAVREAIAVMAEKGVRNSVIDRVIAALRRFLRDMLGLTMRLSEAELRQHIVAAARHVRDGARPREVGAAVPAYSARDSVSAFLRGPAVATVSPDTLAGAGEPAGRSAIEARVLAHLAERDGLAVVHPVIGEIRTLRSGIVSSMRHGYGRPKIAAFAALPDVLAGGRIVSEERSYQGSNHDRLVVAAPVNLDGADYLMGAMVKRSANGSTTFYLHEVTLVPTQERRSAPSNGGANESRSAGQTGVIETLLRDAFEGKLDSQYSRTPGAFYSALVEAVTAGRGAPKRGDAGAWKGWLDGAQRRGEFRQSERDWLGIDAWLDRQSGPITREAIAAYVDGNQVRIEEVALGAGDPGMVLLNRYANTMFNAAFEDLGPADQDEVRAEALIDDTVYGGEGSRYSRYQLPGGENYRELLLTLPDATSVGGSGIVTFEHREDAEKFLTDVDAAGMVELDYEWDQDRGVRFTRFTAPDLKRFTALAKDRNGTLNVREDRSAPAFRSNHFEQPNILAHVRYNERHDVDGKRVLFLEEIQSDWHQEGRKRGYRSDGEVKIRFATPQDWTAFEATGQQLMRFDTLFVVTDRDGERFVGARDMQDAERQHVPRSAGVPDAPFKGTDEWAMLAFKRMVRLAAEGGFDRIAWTPGAMQAERYDLSKQVREVDYVDGRTLIVRDLSGRVVYNDEVPAATIAEVIGKDPAEKLLAATPMRRDGFSVQTIRGDGLKVGGQGMRTFYDSILPNAVNKWAKKLGGRVGEVRVAAPHNRMGETTMPKVHTLDLTDAMRDAALQGLPLFSRPDQVTSAIDSVMAGPPAAFFDRMRTAFRGLAPENLRENTRPAWLGALTLRHLAELGKDIRMPQVGRYADRVQRMATDRNVMHEDAAKVSDGWERFQRRDRAGADATANLMHDTTIAGVDPSTDYVPLMTGTTSRGGDEAVTAESIARRKKLARADLEKASGQQAIDRLKSELAGLDALLAEEKARRDAYPELVRRYAALPEAGRKLYVEARDAYQRQSDRLLAALEARIEALELDGRQKAAMISQVRQEFESARVKGPYFPLQRFGDFWISAEDAGGNPMFTMYERVQDWRDAQSDLKARGFKVKAAGRKLDEARSIAGASGGFMSELMNMLDLAGVDQDTRDEAYQLYLRTLPELSMRKHQIHRKATAGYSKDALRAFSANLFHGSFQIARLRHSHQLEADLLAMKNAVGSIAADDPERAAKAAALYTETGKRHEWVMNPRDSKAASTLTSIGFAWYLGSTPAAALVNLTQTAIVTFPVLAARFGPAKAFNALSAAMGRSLRNVGGDLTRGLSEEEQAAFKEWYASGAIDRSQAHNLAGLSETDTQSYSGVQRRTMEVISWLFHRAEVVNREASALAAFRLARQAGRSFHDATRYAEEVVVESHFDYSNANRARWMQSNAAKVLLLFRQYSLNITWFLWRNLYLGAAGESPEVKSEARAKLAGVLGMTGVFSGLLGMPLMSVMFGVANAAAAAFGGDDDDEPFDAEVAFRNLLTDLLGPDVARILARGPVDYFTGANVSGRVSLNDLWLREPNRELEGKAQANYLLEQAAGPLFGGMLVNTLRGLQQVDEGHTWRGVETMMPKAIKDGMKSLRYATQGVNTLRGDPVIEDLNVGEALLQLAGFSPARLNERYDGINAAKNYEQRLLDRRQRLLNAYAMAWRAGDAATMATVRERIGDWNRGNPTLAITTDTVRRSLEQRMRYSSRAESGVVIDQRVAARAREQGRFAE